MVYWNNPISPYHRLGNQKENEMTDLHQILSQDISRLEEEKASLKKTIHYDIRQALEPSLSDTRDIDPQNLGPRERVLVRHLQQIDRIMNREI